MARELSGGDKVHGSISAGLLNRLRQRDQRAATRDFRAVNEPVENDAVDGIVMIKNKTGSPVEPGYVVGLGDSMILPLSHLANFKTSMLFEGEMPDEDEHDGKFAIVLDGCIADKTAPAILLGLTWCKVEFQSENDTTAGVHDDDATRLKGGGSGAQILYSQANGASYPQDRWCYVRLGGGGGPFVAIGKLYEQLDAGDEAECTLYAWDATTEQYVDLPDRITAHDWMMNPGDFIESGSRVTVGKWRGRWYIIAANCEADEN